MIAFIYPDGRGTVQQDDNKWIAAQKCTVTTFGTKIFGAVFADDKKNFVRCSIPPDKKKGFEQIGKELFKNFTSIGVFDSGNTVYEFNTPLKIEITNNNNLL
jgi:hypothetical protein